MKSDFNLRLYSSICLLFPISEAAQEWTDANLPLDVQTFCGGMVVEHRYIGPIVAGINNDGLTVS